MKKLLFAILVLIAANVAKAQDNVYLRTGIMYEGKIERITDSSLTIHDRASNLTLDCPFTNVSKYKYNGNRVVFADPVKAPAAGTFVRPGDELIKAANAYYGGLALTAVGVFTCIGSPLFYKYEIGDTEEVYQKKLSGQKTLLLVGAGFSIVGTIIQATAFYHIRLAGENLNIITNNNSVGIGIPLK